MTTNSSILAWRIPWAEEFGGLQSKGLGMTECDLDVTAGASSQGTDSEPWPPGLLLGVKLHTGMEHPELEGEGVRSSSVPTVFPETEDGRSPQSPLHAPLLLPSFMTFLPILGPSLSTDLYC